MEIKDSAVRREVIILISCFAAAFITNVVAIICYKGAWYEAFTQIGYVIVLTGVVYVLSIIVRLLIWLIGVIVAKILKRR